MKYYIQDNRVYIGNDVSFWGSDKNGYTTDINKAGLYTKEEAEKITKSRATDVAWPEDYIRERAIMVVDHQDLDFSKGIKNFERNKD